MKRSIAGMALAFVAAVTVLSPSACVAGNKKKQAAKAENAASADNKEVHWLSLDDVQVAMNKQPKKIWIDVYTSWCGWCKVMDKKTYSNPQVIKYINDNFYAVKFDAETKDTIRFMGKMFGFSPEERANHFAVEILKGQLSYPTSVYMDEHYQDIIPIPGYQDVPTMEMILKYLGEGNYKKMSFPDWQKSFKATWAVTTDPANTDPNPPGHGASPSGH